MKLATAATAYSQGRPRTLPGEPGIWVFILGDMLVFAFFFGVLQFYRSQHPEVFEQAQAHMNQALGVLNTFLMLTSSWCVALAVQAARRGVPGVTAPLLSLAFACGLGFCAVKYVEYVEKIHAGLTLGTNEFYTLYYMLTGIHLFHVVVGMVLLAWLIRHRPHNSGYDQKAMRNLEVGATFWHLVDVLWIVLFALFYLVKSL